MESRSWPQEPSCRHSWSGGSRFVSGSPLLAVQSIDVIRNDRPTASACDHLDEQPASMVPLLENG